MEERRRGGAEERRTREAFYIWRDRYCKVKKQNEWSVVLTGVNYHIFG